MEELPIGIRIKNFREATGLGRKAFAEKHDLDIDNYYKWERGTKPSDPNDYKKLESILKGEPPEISNEEKLSERYLRIIESQQRSIENFSKKRKAPDIKRSPKKASPQLKPLTNDYAG